MKERLDVLLVNMGLAPSREKAKALIMAGEVFVDGNREDKAGASFNPEGLNIEVRSKQLKYVSRGGFKLEKAMQVWGIDLSGRVCMDIGSSTGGFTDCMLQNGAVRVYSVDVGRGQLDWKLRNDERVVVMEQTNFRFLTPADIPEKIAFFAEQPEYDKELFVNKKSKTNLENAPSLLREGINALESLETWDHDSIHDCLIGLAETLGVKNGTAMWPVRIAASGMTVTPGGAVEILDILGREESLARLYKGLEKLS